MSDERPNPVIEQLRAAVDKALEVTDQLVTQAAVDEAITAVLAAVEPYVMSNISAGVGGQPLMRQTWQQLYEAEHERRVRGDEWATIVADLDRCEHGRHEGDVCGGASGCNGPSKGNPKLTGAQDRVTFDDAVYGAARHLRFPARCIGFGIDASPICVPSRERMREIAHVEKRALTAADYYRRDRR